MTTIADVEDAFLEGSTQFEEWKAEFDRQFFEPLRDTITAIAIQSLTPEQRAALRDMNPIAYDAVSKRLGV